MVNITDQGGTFVLASNISSTWYLYSHMYTNTNGTQNPNNGIQDVGPRNDLPQDGLPQDVYVYDVYEAINGSFVLRNTAEFTCAPYSVQ